jgi:integration host factor subunit alpha
MTKAEIIDAVYEKVGGFSKKEAAEVVEAVFDTMKEVLTEGYKIKISGFGNFVVRSKKQRTGRNPQTGEPIPISARRVLTFKPSQVLKGILNPHKEQAKQELAEQQGLDGASGTSQSDGSPSASSTGTTTTGASSSDTSSTSSDTAG